LEASEDLGGDPNTCNCREAEKLIEEHDPVTLQDAQYLRLCQGILNKDYTGIRV
jgi:hypothetical protein